MNKYQCANCETIVSAATKPSSCSTCGAKHFAEFEPDHNTETHLDVSVESMLWIAYKSTAIEITLELNRAIHANNAEHAALYFAAWLAKNQHSISSQAALAIVYNSQNQTGT